MISCKRENGKEILPDPDDFPAVGGNGDRFGVGAEDFPDCQQRDDAFGAAGADQHAVDDPQGQGDAQGDAGAVPRPALHVDASP